MEINYADIAEPYITRAAKALGKPTAIEQHEVQIGQAYAMLALAYELKRYIDIASRPPRLIKHDA